MGTDDSTQILHMQRRLSELERHNRANAADVRALSQSVQDMLVQIRELVAVIEAVQGAFKVLDFIGRAAKPIAWLSLVIGSFLVAWNKLTGRS